MSEKWKAPFTTDQVVILNMQQSSGLMHPYTCGNESSHRPLIATRQDEGWFCQDCDYTQDWAHVAADIYGLVGLKGEALEQALLDRPWHPLEDDLIGGWSIMPVPLPPSSGYPEVGVFLGENIARYITQLHNSQLRTKREVFE